MRKFILACACVATFNACASAAPGEPLTGRWGGEHVGVELDADGGRIEYDCAAGTIAGPIVPGRGGQFSASGSHIPGQGGPERIGHVPPSYDARYSGTVRDNEMSLQVEVPARGLSLGPFRLRRRAEPMLMRCL